MEKEKRGEACQTKYRGNSIRGGCKQIRIFTEKTYKLKKDKRGIIKNSSGGLSINPDTFFKRPDVVQAIKDFRREEFVERISDICNFGFKIFDSKEDFRSWMNTQSKALGGITPMELLKKENGLQLVKDELLRIEYNSYS